MAAMVCWLSTKPLTPGPWNLQPFTLTCSPHFSRWSLQARRDTSPVIKTRILPQNLTVMGGTEHPSGKPGQGFLDAALALSSCVLSHFRRGFPSVAGQLQTLFPPANRPPSLTTSMETPSLTGTPPTTASLPEAPHASVGTSAPPLSNVFHWAAAAGCQNAPLAATQWDPSSSKGNNSQPRIALAVESVRTLATFGCQEPAVTFVWAQLMSAFG